MAQKPVLRGEVGCACVAREVSVERGGMGERGLLKDLPTRNAEERQHVLELILRLHARVAHLPVFRAFHYRSCYVAADP